MVSPRTTRSSQTPTEEVAASSTTQLPGVKVLLGPHNVDRLHTLRLPHPKNGTIHRPTVTREPGCPSVFVIDDPSAPLVVHELVAVGAEHCAWLVGASTVERDGRLLTANRVHPAFLLMPHMRANARAFREWHEIVDGNAAMTVLAHSPQFDAWMETIASVKGERFSVI